MRTSLWLTHLQDDQEGNAYAEHGALSENNTKVLEILIFINNYIVTVNIDALLVVIVYMIQTILVKFAHVAQVWYYCVLVSQ